MKIYSFWGDLTDVAAHAAEWCCRAVAHAGGGPACCSSPPVRGIDPRALRSCPARSGDFVFKTNINIFLDTLMVKIKIFWSDLTDAAAHVAEWCCRAVARAGERPVCCSWPQVHGIDPRALRSCPAAHSGDFVLRTNVNIFLDTLMVKWICYMNVCHIAARTGATVLGVQQPFVIRLSGDPWHRKLYIYMCCWLSKISKWT